MPGSNRRAYLGAVLDLSHGVLIATIVISLIFIVLLYRDDTKQRTQRVQALSRLNSAIGGMAGPPYAQVNDIVPGFSGVSISGKKVDVVYSGETKYLFFIFSPDCDACSGQISTWKSIAVKARRDRLILLGLLTSPVVDAPPSFDFDVLLLPDISIKRAYRLVAVPAVMLVSEQGRVEWVHYGSVTPEQIEDLLSKTHADSRTN